MEGHATDLLDSLHAVQSWEHFKEVWIKRYTLWGTDLKPRRYFYSVIQEHDDVEIYIVESQHCLELIETPSEKEVFPIFVNGLDEKIQTHLYVERASTFAEVVRLARGYYLARSHNLRDAPIPKPMHFERTKGTHDVPMELNRTRGRSFRSYSRSSPRSSRNYSRSTSNHSRSSSGSARSRSSWGYSRSQNF